MSGQGGLLGEYLPGCVTGFRWDSCKPQNGAVDADSTLQHAFEPETFG